MNDAKSMLMMYSYAAMKANKPTDAKTSTEDKAEEKATNKDTTKVKSETKTKVVQAAKDTKRRGKKNDE